MTEENINLAPHSEDEAPESDLVVGAIEPSEESEAEEGQMPLFAEISAPEEQIPLWESSAWEPAHQISLSQEASAEDPLPESFAISVQAPSEESVLENISPEASVSAEEEPAEESAAAELTVTEDFYLPMEEIPQRRRRIAEEPLPDQKNAEKKPGRKPGSAVSPLVEFVEIVVGALVAAILVLTLICRTGVVEGTSMLPTMYDGDRYIISDLFYTPEQGDIVVFRPEIDGKDELWIKRVIAVEGQKVYIDPDTYRVYVDDVLLDEPYLEGMGTIPHSTQNPITVPSGCVYVLGDNRGISHDSRYEDLGCVEIGQLAGRVILRFWPLESFGFCE
ncbi:MAG: signal peptidase I [Clostridia bacterium]|nr:signal peptidase I [Clostridia bacterium]